MVDAGGITQNAMSHPVPKNPTPRRCCGARGFTLVEALLAVLMIGVATTAFSAALTAGATQTRIATQYVVATNLATALMDEILARPFDDPNGLTTPGPEPGEISRLLFNSMDDYDGLVEPAGQMRAADGTLLSDASLAGFSRRVSAVYTTVPGRNPALPKVFMRVTVEVTCDGVSLISLQRRIGKDERR